MKVKEFNYRKGKAGENMAREYLERINYKFIEANFSMETGEIDLIMADGDWLVFVEVKYKLDDRLGKPEEMIDRRKMGQIKRLGEMYLVRNKRIARQYIKYRIDAVCILGNIIRHYQNIYG